MYMYVVMCYMSLFSLNIGFKGVCRIVSSLVGYTCPVLISAVGSVDTSIASSGYIS